MDMPDFFRKVCIRARTAECDRDLGIKWQKFNELHEGAAPGRVIMVNTGDAVASVFGR